MANRGTSRTEDPAMVKAKRAAKAAVKQAEREPTHENVTRAGALVSLVRVMEDREK